MKRASIRQVAELSGVSPMTVSRIVQGNLEAVSPEKQARVLQAMRELDYVPVRPVLQNRRAQTRVIGLIVDEIFNYRGRVAPLTFEGIRETAFNARYDVLSLHSRPTGSLEEQKVQLLDRRCDGFIFVGPKERKGVFENLVQHGFPTVSCYSSDVPEGIAWVTPDNEAAMREAVIHLKQLGHRNIVFFAGDQEQSAARRRREAYSLSMEAEGLTPNWGEAKRSREWDTLLPLIEKYQATAVICHNDYMALWLLRSLKEQGVEVPGTLSVVGVDDVPDAEVYGLTTFVNPYRRIGQIAVETLLDLLGGGEAKDHYHLVEMEMVVRGSTASPSH